MAYCRLVSVRGPKKRHNTRIWKGWSESGVEGEGQQRENREGDGNAGGGRRREEVISPLTESSRRWKEPWWGEMDGSVTDWIELECVPLSRLGLHVTINWHKQSTVCTYCISTNFKYNYLINIKKLSNGNHTLTDWSEWFLHLFMSSLASYTK